MATTPPTPPTPPAPAAAKLPAAPVAQPSFAPTPGTIPTVAPSTLADTFAKWQARKQTVVAAGLDPKPLEAVYAQDYAKVAAGGTPMTTEEAQASVQAAYNGAGPIVKGRKTGLLGTLENIVPDAASMFWNFPAGLVNLVRHLPSEITTAGELIGGNKAAQQKVGWEAMSDPGSILRDIAKIPLANLVPGVTVAGELTNPAGRAAMQQHPVGTLLDVLPYAGPLAKLGVLGDVAETTVKIGEAADTADRLVAGGNMDLANQVARTHGFADYNDMAAKVPSSTRATTAFAKGQPIKGVIRSVPKLDEIRQSLLDRFNATPLARGYRRANIMEANRQTRALELHSRNELVPMLAEHKGAEHFTPAEMNEITQLAQHVERWPTAPTKYQAVLDRLRAHADIRAADDVAQAKMVPFTVNGQQVVYSGEQGTRLAAMFARTDRRVAAATEADDAVDRAILDHGTGSPEHQNAVLRSNTAHERLDKADRQFNKLFAKSVPARFVPLVEDQIRQKVMAQMAGTLGDDTPQFRDAMSAYDRGKPLGAYLPPKTLAKYVKEARAGWQDLAKHYDPIWIPAVNADDLEHALAPIRLRDRAPTPSAWKARYVNTAVGSSNYVLALGQAESERLRYQGVVNLTQSFLEPVAKTTSEIDAELSGLFDAERARTPVTTPDAQIQNAIRLRAYTPLDSSLGLGDIPQMQRVYDENKWIPKDLAYAVRKSMETPRVNELSKLNMQAIKLFKFSVMGLSPTHQAHIWLGSALPLLARAGRDEFNVAHAQDAWHMARAMTFNDVTHLDSLTPAVQQTVGLLNRSLDITNAEDLMDFQHGRFAGGLVDKAVGTLEFSRKMSEMGANFYRSVAFLAEEARGLRAGMSEDMAAAEGVIYANKIFVDIGGMTPIEQYVAKQIIPFYSYTRWVLQYVMQYPVDHPIRASILANLGEHEAAYNQAHGIPNTMAMLFNLGKPNAQGDQWGIQLRAFNPFRNTASAFTMAGIVGGLNPELRGLMTAAGVNTLSGSPDPYPGLDIDPNTGGLVGTVKGAGPLAAAEQVVPQLSLLDHYLGLSAQARALRTSDPQAFRRQVFSILNMPFVPQTYTPILSQATHARDQLRVAQAAVSAAIKSQDLSSLEVYPNVPVPAKLRPYVNNQTIVPFEVFKAAVDQIFAWEKQTGTKVL